MDAVDFLQSFNTAGDAPAMPITGADGPGADNARQNGTLAADDTPKGPTARQAAFAAHYVACGNGAEAARRAGYSIDNARYIARDNLKKDPVRQRIRALAAAREEQRRDEAGYLVMMLNAAMEMALAQGQPAAMIRALAHMARLTGLDRPAAPQGLSADAGIDHDAALALATDDCSGLIQEAVLGIVQSAGAGSVAEPGPVAEPGSVAEPGPVGGPDTTKAHKTPHPGNFTGGSAHPPVAPALSRGPQRRASTAGMARDSRQRAAVG